MAYYRKTSSNASGFLFAFLFIAFVVIKITETFLEWCSDMAASISKSTSSILSELNVLLFNFLEAQYAMWLSFAVATVFLVIFVFYKILSNGRQLRRELTEADKNIQLLEERVSLVRGERQALNERCMELKRLLNNKDENLLEFDLTRPEPILLKVDGKYIKRYFLSSEFEHRILVEEAIGRNLRENEVVHHVNGKPDDNKMNNLCLMDGEKHEHFHSWLRWKKEKDGRYPTIERQKKALVQEYGARLFT